MAVPIAPASAADNRWLRLLKHRWVDEHDARLCLDDSALERLQHRIALGEPLHLGRIRVCIEPSLPVSDLWHRASARDRALALFDELGVGDTAQHSGVLVYLLLAEQAIEIVADRGLQQRVPAAHWADTVALVAASCREGRHEEGLLQAIAAAEAVLMQHFPSRG